MTDQERTCKLRLITHGLERVLSRYTEPLHRNQARKETIDLLNKTPTEVDARITPSEFDHITETCPSIAIETDQFAQPVINSVDVVGDKPNAF